MFCFGGLSARRVRAAREYIKENRCAKRPGLTHQWEENSNYGTMQVLGRDLTLWTCSKCGESDYKGYVKKVLGLKN